MIRASTLLILPFLGSALALAGDFYADPAMQRDEEATSKGHAAAIRGEGRLRCEATRQAVSEIDRMAVSRFTASARFSLASSIVSPWVLIPGISWTYAINPPSSQGSKTAVISMFFMSFFFKVNL